MCREIFISGRMLVKLIINENKYINILFTFITKKKNSKKMDSSVKKY